MVYTDDVHLVANTISELHTFARKVGLGRHYYHGVRKGHPHYDLVNKNAKVLVKRNGAIKVSSKEIVKMFNNGALDRK